MWEKSPDTTTRTWFIAIGYAYSKVVGGRKGWRLPTVEELASLVDITQFNPVLPSGHPFTNVRSDLYWSATTDVGNASNAWCVDFNDSFMHFYLKSQTHYVWCVRGGHGYDAY